MWFGFWLKSSHQIKLKSPYQQGECHRASPPLCGPGQQSAERLWSLTAPLGALLCLFKYSRQCCWSVWQRRAHGAALPLRSVKQEQPSHIGQATEKTGLTHRLHHVRALNSWLEPVRRGADCLSGWWASRAIQHYHSPSFSAWKRVAVYLR